MKYVQLPSSHLDFAEVHGFLPRVALAFHSATLERAFSVGHGRHTDMRRRGLLFDGDFFSGIQLDGQHDGTVGAVADPPQDAVPVHRRWAPDQVSIGGIGRRSPFVSSCGLVRRPPTEHLDRRSRCCCCYCCCCCCCCCCC